MDQAEEKAYVYERVLAKADIGVHIITKDGRTAFYNETMSQIEHLAQEEVIQSNLLDIFSFNSHFASFLSP